MHVEVYAAAEEVELRLNGRSLGRAIVGAEFAFRADFDIQYVFGELIAVAYVAGAETGRTSLSSAGEQLHLEAQPERSLLSCDVGDLGFIPIRLTDGHGVVRPLRDRPVTVTVSGAGVLHALGSADPATEETFVSATRTTFDGRAIAIVRPVGLGDILVTIEAPGCAPLEIGLRAAAEHPVELPSLVD